MSIHLAFWSGALADLFVICLLALHGVALARRREFARHRRHMIAAACLVAVFLVAYVVKVATLGGEDLSTWSAGAVALLWFHESCVVVMLLGGGVALWLGRRLAATRLFTGEASDPQASARQLRLHRLAGRSGVLGALLGFLTAALVLIGMFGRA